MTTTFKISRVISHNRNNGGMEVVVKVGDQFVTRHILHGQGHNPDARAIPAHKFAGQQVDELERKKFALESDIKSTKRFFDALKKEASKNLMLTIAEAFGWEIKMVSEVLMSEELDKLEVALTEVTEKLQSARSRKVRVEREMPLMVSFVS